MLRVSLTILMLFIVAHPPKSRSLAMPTSIFESPRRKRLIENDGVDDSYFQYVKSQNSPPAFPLYKISRGNEKGICTGLRIDENKRSWILTAAHCFAEAPLTNNYLRSTDPCITVSSANKATAVWDSTIEYSILKVIFSKHFSIVDNLTNSKRYDVALAQIDTSAQTPTRKSQLSAFGASNITIKCDIFDAHRKKKNSCYVLRHGASDMKHEVNLDYCTGDEDKKCKNWCYLCHNYRMCGDYNNVKGESGAPIICKNTTDQGGYVIAGVVAQFDTIDPKYPGVYTIFNGNAGSWVKNRLEMTEQPKCTLDEKNTNDWWTTER